MTKPKYSPTPEPKCGRCLSQCSTIEECDARLFACASFCSGIHIETLTLLNGANHPTLKQICEENQELRARPSNETLLKRIEELEEKVTAYGECRAEDGQCFWCGRQTNIFSSDPRFCAVWFPENEPGLMKCHCMGCVTDRLAQLDAAKRAVEWISVEERLPEQKTEAVTDVLIWDGFAVRQAWFDEGKFQEWDNHNIPEQITAVTHWRELPEPPRAILAQSERPDSTVS